MSDKLNEAAAQNLSLQGQIDNLTEQISMVAKVRANASGAVASGEALLAKLAWKIWRFLVIKVELRWN